MISYRKFEPHLDSITYQKLSFIPRYTLTRERNSIEPMNTYEIRVWPCGCESASSAVLVHVGKPCSYIISDDYFLDNFVFQIGTANFLVVQETDARGRSILTLHSVALIMQLGLVSCEAKYLHSV